MNETLTPKQGDVLRYIRIVVMTKGYPPTRREIADHFGWSSENAVNDHLRALQRKGAISVERDVSRGIRILRHDMPVGGGKKEACGDGCKCLTVCGDYYDHAGIPSPAFRVQQG